MKKLLWLALTPFLLLAACADDDAKSTTDAAKLEKSPPKQAKLITDNMICPQVAIVQQAQTVRDYGRERPDAAQLVASARMKKIEGDCAYRSNSDDKDSDDKKSDDKQSSGIDINFTLHMTAMRGPRLGGSSVSFPYFIAVVDPADTILSRQVVTASFVFDGQDKRADDDEALHVFIPLSPAALQAGPDYRVLTGFKVPKDQIGN